MGPFLDERHKVIENGNIELQGYSYQYDDLFKYLMSAIESRLSTTQTEILIQPSIRDVHHPYPFPQPAFENQFPRIHCLTNPQKIILNGVTIQILNIDLIKDMEYALVSRPKADSPEQSLKLCIDALLEQKSLYPIFPPPSNDLPVEYKYRKAFGLTEQPDILITHSSRPCFLYVFSYYHK